MIAKTFRFHGHTSVRSVYRRGHAVRNTLGSMHWYDDSRAKNPKIAVVVSRKVSKSAVVRNRIRRRIYEVIRLEMPAITRPAQIVFTVYQVDAAIMPHDALRVQLTDLLGQARLK